MVSIYASYIWRDQPVQVKGSLERYRDLTYIDDCIEGTLRLFESDYSDPVNIGSDEQVSINQMLNMIEDISDYKFERKYLLDKPKGVRGRSSNNDFIKSKLNWSPSINLEDGLLKTYNWIENQIKQKSNIKKFSRF